MDDPRPSPVSNMPEYTVSEISGAVKRTLENTFGRVRVRGELTEVKRFPSGHIYLSLKDEGAKISGIVWKSTVPRLGMVPENGTEVIATGRISAFGERSSYQLIIERMEYAGVGALLARIEMIRQRLGGRGAVRCRPQTPAARVAEGDWGCHQRARRGDPGYQDHDRPPVSANDSGVAGAGAG